MSYIVVIVEDGESGPYIGPFNTAETALAEAQRLNAEIEEDNRGNNDELPTAEFDLLRSPGIPWADLQ